MNSPLSVAVLFGGASAQREVSLASGISIASALEIAGHFACGIDPSEVDLVEVDWRRFDACFLALVGGEGECGSVQRLLGTLGIPFTGSSALASQRALSKSAAKERFLAAGLQTPPFTMLHANEPIGRMVNRVETLGYPVVIKPDAQGSSLGVGLAHDRDELECCIAEAQFFDRFLVAESYIRGREFTVAIVGRQPLPLAEMLVEREILTSADKRQAASACRFDLELSTSVEQELVQTALAAAEALETTGLVRVDLRLDALGVPWILEVNTSPELSAGGVVVQAAERAGLPLPTLCERLVRDCLFLESRR